MSLVELQKFLAEELAEVEPQGTFARSFTPLTDGLGLESPKRKEPPVQAKPTPKPAPLTSGACARWTKCATRFS